MTACACAYLMRRKSLASLETDLAERVDGLGVAEDGRLEFKRNFFGRALVIASHVHCGSALPPRVWALRRVSALLPPSVSDSVVGSGQPCLRHANPYVQ